MRRIVFSIFVLVVLAAFTGGCGKTPGFHRGDGFTVNFPPSWIKNKDWVVEPRFNLKSKFEPYSVTYVTPEQDPDTLEPYASISIYRTKPDMQIWLEDEFPNIVDTFYNNGYDVLDKGEVKIDNQLAKWLVYRDNRKGLLNLEFYIVNDNNVLFRIQYCARDDKFSQYRPLFEGVRESIKLNRW